MPRVIAITPELTRLIKHQSGLVTVAQLFAHGIGRSSIEHRVGKGVWRRLLPGVILTQSGSASATQVRIAALLWAGPESALDAACACFAYGVTVAGYQPGLVHVVAPFATHARSGGWLRVRRTIAEIDAVASGALRYVRAPVAFLTAARAAKTFDDAIATLSRGLQAGAVSLSGLHAARESIGDKGCGRLDKALAEVAWGVRSPAEKDGRNLILTSRTLPEPRWNCWLDLGDGGRPVCVDALWLDAGMVFEINGRKYHGWGEAYEDMHVRRTRLVSAGLVVVDATPRQIRRQPGGVLEALERTHARNAGRGLPAGVTLIDPPAWATHCG